MVRKLATALGLIGLVGVFTLGGATASAFANPVGPTTVGEFTFTADDSNVPAGAELTAYSGSDAHLTIPATVLLGGTTYDVTSIATSVFDGDTSMMSVSIPDTVTTLGD